MPLLAPLAATAIAYGATVLLQYERELRRMRRLRDLLRGFVPPGTLDDLLKPQKSARRTSYGLCLVTDAQGFTRFAEERPPEAVAASSTGTSNCCSDRSSRTRATSAT